MRLLRILVFYLLVVIFLVSCPLVILYALGYVLKPGTEQGVVKTGLIYLSSAPPGASVYLGNRRYTKKTPTILRDLLPGDYSLRLILRHHKPWVQTVPVEAERATVLEHILLLPQAWPREEVLPQPFEDLCPLPGSRFFLLSRGPKAEDILIYDWKDAQSWPLFAWDSPYQGGKVVSHVQVQDSPAMLLRVDLKAHEHFVWIEPRGGQTRIEDLTNLFMEKPLRILWDAHERRYLFTFQHGYLNRLDTLSKEISPQFVEGVLGYGVFDRWLYVLKDDNTFARMTFDGKNVEQLLSDPVFERSLFGGKGFFDIHVLSKDVMFFLGERGELFVNRLPYRLVEKGVVGLDPYPQRARVLLWQKDRLGILDFSNGLSAEELLETPPQLQWVFQQGVDIEQVFWVYGGSHVLFRDEDRVLLLELETSGKPHLCEVIQVKRKSSVFYSDDSGKLYYLDRSTGTPSSIEILPKRELLPIPFPERREKSTPQRVGE